MSFVVWSDVPMRWVLKAVGQLCGPVPIGPVEMLLDHIGATEIGANQTGPSKVGLHEPCASKISSEQVRPDQLRPAQVRLFPAAPL